LRLATPLSSGAWAGQLDFQMEGGFSKYFLRNGGRTNVVSLIFFWELQEVLQMNSKSDYEDWEDVQFIHDAVVEVLGGNYDRAVEVLRKGIDMGLAESSKSIDSHRLLHTLRLLIHSVVESIDTNFGVRLGSARPIVDSIDRCSICGRTRSEVGTLFSGVSGGICGLCIEDICAKKDTISDGI
jgi:hypothetical protein